MAHTYPNVLVHCVFATKGRRNTIPSELIERLGLYIVGIGKNHDIPVQREHHAKHSVEDDLGSLPGTSVPGFRMVPLRG